MYHNPHHLHPQANKNVNINVNVEKNLRVNAGISSNVGINPRPHLPGQVPPGVHYPAILRR